MRMPNLVESWRGARRGVAIALLCFVALAGLQQLGAFGSADLKLSDWRFRLRGPRPTSDAIALVEVDDATVAAYGGRWPIPRDQYALLIEALEEAGARAIGLDLLFHDAIHPRTDSLLAAVIAGHPNVVTAVYFPSGGPGAANIDGGTSEELEALRRSALHTSSLPAPDAGGVIGSLAVIASATSAIGHTSVWNDPDGAVRGVPLFVRLGRDSYPCLALSVIAASRGRGTLRASAVRGGLSLVLPGGEALQVPVDPDGVMRIDFSGDRPDFAHVQSLIEVLNWYTEGRSERLRAAFSGRLVLVGSTAAAAAASDVGATPYSPTSPLLYVHANAVDNLLGRRFLHRPPTPAVLGACAIVAVLLGIFFSALPGPWAGVALLVALAAAAGLDLALFARWSLDVSPTLALLLPTACFAGIQGDRFFRLESATKERAKELRLARKIQRKLLPGDPPVLPGLDIYGLNIPAQEVGGDYYDWAAHDVQCLFGLGDVSGKGVAAALLMSHLRASFHSLTDRPDASPAQVLGAMNHSLAKAVDPGKFCTFFLAAVSLEGQELRFANAGHCPALLYRDGKLEFLSGTGLPLGVFHDSEYEEVNRAFAPGDVLVVYSDGITECAAREEMYGEGRLSRLVLEIAGGSRPAREIADRILEDVRGFAHGDLSSDDVTLLVVRRTDGGR
jgi:serine phosphatase RsbU (regulator of sigma subunit)/CHASE2 domain-containing sensor protein